MNEQLTPYNRLPEYDSRSFSLRLVSMGDAEDLLECYSDPAAQVLFNSDNCTGDFKMTRLDDMKLCIGAWLDAYSNREYARLSVIHKKTDKAVGTVEIFGGEYGVLRIDLLSEYEEDEYLSEIIELADSFFSDFGCDNIITKAVPEATKRIAVLVRNGYSPSPLGDRSDRKHYYIKSRA